MKTGKKRKELTMRANLKSLPKYLGIGAVFVASALVLNFVLSLLFKLPGLGAVPGWALPTASAILSLVMAYTAGLKLTTKKRSFATAFTYLLIFVAASYFLAPQISPVPAPQPIPLPPPSKPPEGYVEFYYQASFTFLGGDTSTIQNVELWLPWPYIDTKETRPFAKPVGLDNWLRVENGFISMFCEKGPLFYTYYVNALNLKENEIFLTKFENTWSLNINVENGIWTTNRDIEYTELEELKIDYESQGPNTVNSAFFARASGIAMDIFQKVIVRISMMSAGDKVLVNYRFFVQKEEASKIRLDDWLYSYWYAVVVLNENPPKTSGPYIGIRYSGSTIQCTANALLFKNTNGTKWEKVASYLREWSSFRSGSSLIFPF
ncbi:MAG: hypothetical protein QXS27_08160 [Candidatus Jordarchaeaceae archaeon]